MLTTSYAVLDSGTLLATVQTETLTEQAKSLIVRLNRAQIQLVAPTLLRYELVAVVRKWVYRQLATPQNAEMALNTVLRYPITLMMDDALLRRAYELATQFNRPTAYDSQYLALAERLSCEFWTADERLFNAVTGQFTQIRWLGNFQ